MAILMTQNKSQFQVLVKKCQKIAVLEVLFDFAKFCDKINLIEVDDCSNGNF